MCVTLVFGFPDFELAGTAGFDKVVDECFHAEEVDITFEVVQGLFNCDMTTGFVGLANDIGNERAR